MPQLVPFFFLNQVIFTLIILAIIFYTFNKYLLPWFFCLFISRVFINNL